MKRPGLLRIAGFFCLLLTLTYFSQAQVAAAPGFADSNPAQAVSTRTFSFAGSIPGQLDGSLSLTFAIYSDQQSAAALWTETQVVQVTAEKYSVLLGSASATGIPSAIFSADEAHWLGVQVNGTEKRYLLVSVPYAIKAVDSERLGGLPFTQYVTAQQLQAALQSAAVSGSTSQPKVSSSGPIGQAAAAGTPPQPATDFTDNNASEVLLVTQQGTGYAIHAITSSQAEAILAQNDSIGGTAFHALATAATGQSLGVFGEVASPDGIAGVFNNRTGGKILSLRNNGVEVGGFDANGNLTANGNVQALSFIGSGAGLTDVPFSAVNATPLNVPNSVVSRDSGGSFSANNVSANIFFGSGAGLVNVPLNAVNATPVTVPNSVVARDFSGSFSANQISANTFSGSGSLLIGIPNAATTATSSSLPNTIVSRDASGNFSTTNVFALGLNATGQLTNTGFTDLSNGNATLPVHAVTAANTPTTCVGSRELLIKTDVAPGQQLFICNASGNGWNLVGDGVATGVGGIASGDPSIVIGGTAQLPSISVANGGITAAKLAPNAVSGNIADGSLPAAKIAGTAAILGANSFTGTQSMPSLNAGTIAATGSITGSTISTAGGFFSGPTNVNTGFGTALAVSGGDTNNPAFTSANAAPSGVGLQGTSTGSNGVGVLGRATGGQSVAGLFVNAQGNGRIISAGVGAGFGSEVFSVDTAGNVFHGGAQVMQFSNSTLGTTAAGLAKLDANGFAVSTTPVDTSGAVGIVVSNAGTFGPVRIAYAGTAFCVFDGLPHILDYVQISRNIVGLCSDVGPVYPTTGQVIGRVTGVAGGSGGFVLLSGTNTQAISPGITSIKTGAGLAGGTITTAGTISIPNFGVTNSMLQNSSITIAPGSGLGGGGVVPLGGVISLNNLGVLSFNGRAGNITPALGDYSFSQISGTVSASQLPTNTALTSQSNTFTANQTINGLLTTTNGILTSGNSTPSSSVASVSDTSAAGNQAAFSASSSNNPAAIFLSSAPTLLTVGTPTHGVLSVNNTGMVVTGSLSATSLSGDGSALSNITASRIGTLAPTDLATVTALNNETTARQASDASLQTSLAAETTARQSDVSNLQTSINSESTARQAADTTLQNNVTAETSARQTDVANLQANIGAEVAARQAGDASVLSSLSAETTARQSDVSNLQTSINNLSAADAKLAASNTFTTGTQDFSGATATLPVQSVLSANAPAACVANKELLIKTDAPAGQQLFICNGTANGWNLVGDGGTNAVSSFNGRNGSVTPATGDYSFAQISGAASASQLPATVVFNNQANSFAGNQTVNGTLSATSLSGNGAGVSNVNAITLNGLPSNALAQLHAVNTFTSEQLLAPSTAVNPSLNMQAGTPPATPLAGDIWNNGGVIQYRDNASTTRSLVTTTQSGGLQLLKLTASVTPASVASQVCTEESFTVAGITTGDVLLSVLQPSTSSPGVNIAIGGFRVSAANTVAVQFCNVSRNSSTPVSGTYTFAIMR